MSEERQDKQVKRKWTKVEDRVANAIIQTKAMETRCGYCLGEKMGCRDGCFRRKCVQYCYLQMVFLALVSFILFIAFTVWLAVPSLQTKGYLSASCSVSDVDHVSDNSCECGKGCYGKFPCLIVKVSYTIENYGDYSYLKGRGKLYDVEFGGECSFTPPCSHIEWANRESVWDWRRQIRNESPFSCFIEPPRPDQITLDGYIENDGDDSNYIMRKRRLSYAGAVNFIFWPLLAFVVFVVVVVMMCCTCGCGLLYEKQPPREITECADALLRDGKTVDHLDNMEAKDRAALIYEFLRPSEIDEMLERL